MRSARVAQTDISLTSDLSAHSSTCLSHALSPPLDSEWQRIVMTPLSLLPMVIRTIGRFPHLRPFTARCSTADRSLLRAVRTLPQSVTIDSYDRIRISWLSHGRCVPSVMYLTLTFDSD